jgi:hypothetical protein
MLAPSAAGLVAAPPAAAAGARLRRSRAPCSPRCSLAQPSPANAPGTALARARVTVRRPRAAPPAPLQCCPCVPPPRAARRAAPAAGAGLAPRFNLACVASVVVVVRGPGLAPPPGPPQRRRAPRRSTQNTPPPPPLAPPPRARRAVGTLTLLGSLGAHHAPSLSRFFMTVGCDERVRRERRRAVRRHAAGGR